jgi:S1-C subfamily serine protease
VLRVDASGAAAAAGLLRGDLVTAAAGVDVRTVADLDRAARRAHGLLSLRLVRGAESLELAVPLD